MIVPVAMAYIGEISPREKEGSYMGLFSVSLFLGFGFGPFIGGVIQNVFGTNADFIAMGSLCGIAFLLVLVYLPSFAVKNHIEKSEPIAFRTILNNAQVKGILCYRFVNAFGRGSIITFLPLYAGQVLNLNGAQIGIIISSAILLTSVLQIPFGRLADSVNRKVLILGGSLFYFIAVFFFHTL